MTDLREQIQQDLGKAYTLEQELGGGGMSRVFVATDNALGRKIVIKILPSELAAAVSSQRFGARFSSQRICSILISFRFYQRAR